MLINNSHIQGIFKYDPDIEFEYGDFIVFGNCLYICKSPNPVSGIEPGSNNSIYSLYPGEKITSYSEFYDYMNSASRGEYTEDKYVSAHVLCEILENMYYGFGDNGKIVDHVIYNPEVGIYYSVKGVTQILTNYTTSVLNDILERVDLNNGYLRVSRNLPEIGNILLDMTSSESDVVILRQYTYLDSSEDREFRVQELIDPEKNHIYYRFCRGTNIENGVINEWSFNSSDASGWKNLYLNNEDILTKLQAIEDYYRNKSEQIDDLYRRIVGKYCYREVSETEDNNIPSESVIITPNDIEGVETFLTGSCYLDIIVRKTISDGLYKNYSTTIDIKDVVGVVEDLEIDIDNTISYSLSDDVTLTVHFEYDALSHSEILTLDVNNVSIIKNIYYRDYTLGHYHTWVVMAAAVDPLGPARIEPTCTESGWGTFECRECGETKTDTIPALGHNLRHGRYTAPTCITTGNNEYWYCNRCNIYFSNQECTAQYSGWDTGEIPVVIQPIGGAHVWGNWVTVHQSTCTEDGLRRRTCRVCGATEETVLPALGHNLEEIPEVSCTCGEDGTKKHYKCIRCHLLFHDSDGTTPILEEDTIEFATGDHSYNTEARHILIPNTCTSDGRGYFNCTTCRHHTLFTIPHNHRIGSSGAAVRYVQPTCTERGYILGVCEVCNQPNSREIDYSSSGNPLGHTIREHTSSNYTPATCEEGAYWTGTCSRCGATNVKEYDLQNPALGHDVRNSEDAIYTRNTEDTDACWTGTCSRCDISNVSEVDEEHKAFGYINLPNE